MRRILIVAAACVALGAAGCGEPETPEGAPAAEAAAAAPETGADAEAVRAAVGGYLSRPPEEIAWDEPLASQGMDGLDASDLLMAVEEDLGVVIRNQDLEALVGSADVNALHERLTPRTIVRLVEMGRAVQAAGER